MRGKEGKKERNRERKRSDQKERRYNAGHNTVKSVSYTRSVQNKGQNSMRPYYC
jgi:hypothetical protein